MLKVLLCITSGVLSHQPPDSRGTSLGGRLAQPIFQVNCHMYTLLDLFLPFHFEMEWHRVFMFNRYA